MTIGNFTIGYLLGKGADAEVRTINQSSMLNKKLAVKILKCDNSEQHKRYNKEVQITQSLNHENIIKFYGSQEKDGNIYMFMDRIEGTTLEEYCKEEGDNGVDEEKVKDIFRQLINAIVYCHNNGIAHRDIKLDNIMLDSSSNKPVIIDFGYCGIIGPSLFVDAVGSPLYNSPEKIRAVPYCGKKSDIWSLGVCLFKLLNGYFPFYPYNTGSVEELTDLIKTSEPYQNDSISDDANDLLEKMLEKNPNKRITAIEILSHPWLNKSF